MVAMISKSEKQAGKFFEYIKEAMENMTIDMNGDQAYALVPSQSGDMKYKVLFAEPAKEIPYATDCSCYDHRTNDVTCKHMHIVNTYYQMIYGIHRSPVIREDAPETDAGMSPDCPPVVLALSEDGDESETVEEHFTRADLIRYEHELSREGIKDLRSRVKSAGLDVASRSKAPLIVALLAWKRDELQGNIAPKVSPDCPDPVQRVHEALMQLTEVCDGARSEDGQGFNGVDAEFGHSLARQSTLSPKQAVAAAKMLKKYRKQLGGNVPSVAEVEAALAKKAEERMPPTGMHPTPGGSLAPDAPLARIQMAIAEQRMHQRSEIGLSEAFDEEAMIIAPLNQRNQGFQYMR